MSTTAPLSAWLSEVVRVVDHYGEEVRRADDRLITLDAYHCRVVRVGVAQDAEDPRSSRTSEWGSSTLNYLVIKP
jgi:hypothetical protein